MRSIEHRQAATEALFAEVFGEAKAAGGKRIYTYRTFTAPAEMTDDELIARIRESKQGGKFDRLFYGTNPAADYGGDESAADYALAVILCGWTNKDESRVIRLMRRATCSREKWNRPDYLPRSVANAAQATTWTYDGRTEPADDAGDDSPANGTDGTPAEVQPAAWEPPIDLGRAGAPPAFPTDALPEWQRAYVEALATETQTPPDLAGALVLPPVAAACQGRLEVEPRAGWHEPVNLFVAAVLPPATRKGPVFADTSAPVGQFEAAEVERQRDAVAERNALHAAAKARVEHLTQAVAKAKTPEDAAEAKNQLAAAARELAQMTPAVLPRYLADDVTPEKLASILAEQNGRLAVFAPEGGELFELMSGRYGNGPNFGVFLKGHAGDALRVDRGGRPAEFVDRPALTIAMAVQPDVIAGLHAKAGFRGRGLLGRFLYAVPVPTVGSRRTDAEPVPAAVRQRYRENVTRLLEAFRPSQPRPPQSGRLVLSPAGGRRVLRFAPDAYAVFNAFEAELEPRLGEFGDLGHVADWAGKLAGAVARIAGLLHVAGGVEAGDPWDEEITADEARSAVALGRYFIGHALVAFGLMGADPALEAARHVLRWVLLRRLEAFTRRDLHQALKGRFPRAEQLDAPLGLLERHGYVRERTMPARTGEDGKKVRGRKPSATYEVNPLALNSEDLENCEGHSPESKPPSERVPGRDSTSEDAPHNSRNPQNSADDPGGEDGQEGALDPSRAFPHLDELIDAAEAVGADWLASPWREARAAGEAAVYARSTVALERACSELRALVAGGLGVA